MAIYVDCTSHMSVTRIVLSYSYLLVYLFSPDRWKIIIITIALLLCLMFLHKSVLYILP